MENKKKTTIMTGISALLFCMLIVAGSLSPLSKLGKQANQFNSLGMWSAIAMILIFYIAPLALYLAGLKWMKYVMAVFCALGLVTFVLTMVAVIGIGVAIKIIPSLISIVVICIAAIIVNSVWFFVVFRSKGNQSAASIH